MVLQYHAGEYVAALFLERITILVILFFRYRCGVSLWSIASPIRKLGSPPCFSEACLFQDRLSFFIRAAQFVPMTIGTRVADLFFKVLRSEERRVGKECRSRGAA